MQTSCISELDFTKAIIKELVYHNILTFNINELEDSLYPYIIQYKPLFINIGTSFNHLDLSESIWFLNEHGILYLNYPDIEIKSTNFKIDIESKYLALIESFLKDFLCKTRPEESVSVNIIKASPNNHEFQLIEGEYVGREIRWNIITDGKSNIRDCQYVNESEITECYLQVENATYLIHNCYVNGTLNHVDIYTEIEALETIERLKEIAYSGDHNLRLSFRKRV